MVNENDKRVVRQKRPRAVIKNLIASVKMPRENKTEKEASAKTASAL